KLYAEWFAKFHTIFHRCTFSTASTPFIAEKMSALKKAFVIHNGLNKEQLAIAEKLQVKKEPYSICYLSGSKSHDRDFAQVQPAIERIMEENDAVHFYVAGYLNESLSNRFADRIVRLPYMPWQKLLAFNAKMSVNLAPLDTENPFCHAKSELKYFEAALVGVPTVASPTDTFVKCIRSGENGFLAESEEEWYQAIHTLLEDQKLAIRMSDLAKQDVLERYAPQAIGKEAFAVYQNILKEAKTVFKK
ncbi:MAG TPA: hypothetical protein DEP42_05745, partial [Ruminococcaceae bacterium]|nr:hypothetical protein [Oscillospiraceae bacterium]